MALTPPRPTSTRGPVPPITRKVPASELDPLVDASRPSGAGLPAGHAAAPNAGVERPYLPVSAPAEPTVVLAPELLARPSPAPPAAAAPQIPPAPVSGRGADVEAVLQHARMDDTASPFEATRVAGSSPVGTPRVAAAPPKTLLYVGVGVITAVVVGAVLFVSSLGEDAPAPAAAASGSAGSPATAAPPSAAAAAGSASPSPGTAVTPPAAAPAAGPEAEARAALSRLRDGIGTCVREVIGVLPGTSPAIPAAMATLKGGAYKSVPRDYRSPVFSCTKYRENEPQRFQIQWQLVTRPSEGRGVAWLDDDGDGRADRAFAFRAALTGKSQVELGEIGPLDPVPPIMKALE